MNTYKALEIWTAQTTLNIGILLSIVSAILHFARPYFDRVLSRMTLRVAADFWWLLYIILRDGLLFLSVILILLNINLDLMADIKIALPFVPFGMLLLIVALMQKIFSNTEDIGLSQKRNIIFVGGGALLNFLGYVFVMEAPGDEYTAATQVFWQTMKSLRSNLNPELSTVIFYITLGLLFLTVLTAMIIFNKRYNNQSKNNV